MSTLTLLALMLYGYIIIVSAQHQNPKLVATVVSARHRNPKPVNTVRHGGCTQVRPIRGSPGIQGPPGRQGLPCAEGPQGVPGPQGLSGVPGVCINDEDREIKAHRVEKGPTDTKDEKVDQGLPRVQPESSVVVFTVTNTTPQKEQGSDSGAKLVKFNNIITQVGTGFNTTQSKFVCPTPGVYQFHYSFLATHGASASRVDVGVKLVLNDKPIMVAYASASAATGTSFANLILKTGDKVWLTVDKGQRIFNWGLQFSGNLLHHLK